MGKITVKESFKLIPSYNFEDLFKTRADSRERTMPSYRAMLLGLVFATALLIPGPAVIAQISNSLVPASSLPDLSGIAWLGDDMFLAVHDAKNPDELDRPRVSLLKLPQNLDGVLWQALTVDWMGNDSSDLESAARIPGTRDVLLVESGDDGKPMFQRIFRAQLDGNQLTIKAVADWPVDVFNVEASAVARIGKRFVFLYAERAQRQPTTKIRWSVFDPETLTFGRFRSVTLDNPDPDRTNRPVVAMDIGRRGEIYIASAFDPEAAGLPNPDNGPFASSVWLVGKIMRGRRGAPVVRLLENPERQGTLDGMKVESVAVRRSDSGVTELFVGFDDENYGATMRQLPPPRDNETGEGEDDD